MVDLSGDPAPGVPVHASVDGGAAKAYTTDANGKLNITIPKGAHAVSLAECDTPVYMNNYSGSGTVTTRTGYCKFSFTVPTMTFTDVDRDDWFWDTVSWAWENGVMTGKSAAAFDPNGLTTRAEAVKSLWNMDGAKYVDFILPFSDAAESAWYLEILFCISPSLSERVELEGSHQVSPQTVDKPAPNWGRVCLQSEGPGKSRDAF